VGIFSSREPDERSGIVSLLVPDDPREVVRRCKAANMVVSQRGGRVRVSPHAYNITDELDRLVQLLGAKG
jgi:selenocysteine lyase/cysteine desulfurase